MKQKTKQTQISINERVKFLIRAFNKLHEEYISKSYDLLSEIYKLRKIQNPKYTLEDLENEEGLETHKDKIRPIWRYGTATDDLIQDLTPSQRFLLANVDRELRDKESQNKIADMLVKGEIKDKDLISSKNTYWIMQKIRSGNKLEYENKIILETLYGLKEIADKLRDNKEIVTRKRYRKKMDENFNILKRTYKRVMK